RVLWDRLVEAVGLPSAAPEGVEALDVDVSRVRAAADGAALLDRLAGEGVDAVAGAWEGAEGRSALSGLALAYGDGEVAWLDAALLADQQVAAALDRLLQKVPVDAHDAKALMRSLRPLGVDFTEVNLATAIAAYLLDPGQPQYLLEDLAQRYAGIELRSADAAPAGQLDLDGAPDRAEEAGLRAAAVVKLHTPLAEALVGRKLFDLYDQ